VGNLTSIFDPTAFESPRFETEILTGCEYRWLVFQNLVESGPLNFDHKGLENRPWKQVTKLVQSSVISAALQILVKFGMWVHYGCRKPQNGY